MVCNLGARTPAIALFFLDSMRGRHAWNRLDRTE
jgi:hypothetical protein